MPRSHVDGLDVPNHDVAIFQFGPSDDSPLGISTHDYESNGWDVARRKFLSTEAGESIDDEFRDLLGLRERLRTFVVNDRYRVLPTTDLLPEKGRDATGWSDLS